MREYISKVASVALMRGCRSRNVGAGRANSPWQTEKSLASSLNVPLDAPAIISSNCKLGFRFVWTAVTVLNYSHIFCSVQCAARKTPRRGLIKSGANAGVAVVPLAEGRKKSAPFPPENVCSPALFLDAINLRARINIFGRASVKDFSLCAEYGVLRLLYGPISIKEYFV